MKIKDNKIVKRFLDFKDKKLGKRFLGFKDNNIISRFLDFNDNIVNRFSDFMDEERVAYIDLGILEIDIEFDYRLVFNIVKSLLMIEVAAVAGCILAVKLYA